MSVIPLFHRLHTFHYCLLLIRIPCQMCCSTVKEKMLRNGTTYPLSQLCQFSLTYVNNCQNYGSCQILSE